jgi:hypothetical protein
VAGLAFPHAGAVRKIEVGSSVTTGLLNFIRDHPDRFRRPLVTTWNAGPLLWNLRPDFRVSFDDRGDFYGDPTVFAFVALFNTDSGWRETLAQGDFDSAIVDDYLPLTNNLPLLPAWKRVYQDAKTTVFWRSGADLPAAPPLKE